MPQSIGLKHHIKSDWFINLRSFHYYDYSRCFCSM